MSHAPGASSAVPDSGLTSPTDAEVLAAGFVLQKRGVEYFGEEDMDVTMPFLPALQAQRARLEEMHKAARTATRCDYSAFNAAEEEFTKAATEAFDALTPHARMVAKARAFDLMARLVQNSDGEFNYLYLLSRGDVALPVKPVVAPSTKRVKIAESDEDSAAGE